jgi:hypothetical protein
VVRQISHQAASDPYPDLLRENVAWFDIDGTPLFYSAWRAKPGPISPEPKVRSSVVKHGARVSCWPQAGGIWIKNADLVDLNFLGISRMDDTPRQFNQTAENEFCEQLRAIGAEWWTLPPPFYEREHLGREQFACDTLETCFKPDVQFHHLIAWAETEQAACYIPMAHVEHKGQSALNWFHNSMDMDERCGAIMRLGGKWCRCKDECPDLKDLDWGSRDRGSDGCDDPPLYMVDPEDSFGPETEL